MTQAISEDSPTNKDAACDLPLRTSCFPAWVHGTCGVRSLPYFCTAGEAEFASAAYFALYSPRRVARFAYAAHAATAPAGSRFVPDRSRFGKPLCYLLNRRPPFRRLDGSKGEQLRYALLSEDPSDPGSSPCSRQPRSPARRLASRRCWRTPRQWHGVGRLIRRRG